MKIRRGVDPADYKNPPGVTKPPAVEHTGERRPPRTAPAAVKAAAGEANADPAEEKVGHREPTDREQQAGFDPVAIAADHDQATTGLLDKWPALAAVLVAALAAAGGTAVAGGAVSDLASLTVDGAVVADLTSAIASAMDTLSVKAAKQAAAEVAHQGGSVTVPKRAGADANSQVAQVLARLLVDGYATAAVRVAMQNAGQDEDTVRQAIEDALNQMSDADKGWVADNLGAAMAAAQRAGRDAVFNLLPADTKYLSSEILDRSTCAPCKDVDGTEYDSLTEARKDYPVSGYMGCLGRSRCRGHAIPILT